MANLDPIADGQVANAEAPVGKGVAIRYLLVFAVPLLFPAALIALALIYLHSVGKLAPVPLTGSISFNEKAELLRRDRHMPIDVLAVGSSMTLDNLDGQIVKEHLPGDANLFNAGSFGLKISQSAHLAQLILRKRNPAAVIMVTGPEDFTVNQQAGLDYDDGDFERFTDGGFYPWFVARHFDMAYYRSGMKEIRLDRRSRRDYGSLAFDKYGGVLLNIHFPHVNMVRWNARADLIHSDPTEWDAFESFAEFLHQRKISFYVAQSPLRKAPVNAEMASLMKARCARLARIVEAHGGAFFDGFDHCPLDDSYFADYAHLNAQGADKFTTAFMDAIDPELKTLQFKH